MSSFFWGGNMWLWLNSWALRDPNAYLLDGTARGTLPPGKWYVSAVAPFVKLEDHKSLTPKERLNNLSFSSRLLKSPQLKPNQANGNRSVVGFVLKYNYLSNWRI